MAKVPGKAWATFGFATGIIASIAANVAHSFVPPHGAVNWQPQPGAIVFAGFWPVALLIAIEVIARVDWPHGKSWWLVRYGGLVAVAAIAATLSYRHMSALLTYYGEDALGAAIGPMAVDGLMAVCTAALLATTRHGRSESPADGLEAVSAIEETPEPPPAVLEAPSEAEGGGNVPPPSRRAARQLATRQRQADRKEAARQAYRASLATGQPLTYQELAKQHRMSERWARDRIREAKAA